MSAAQLLRDNLLIYRNQGYRPDRTLVEEYTEGRQFGFMGESGVNVLLLNLALDEVASLTEEP